MSRFDDDLTPVEEALQEVRAAQATQRQLFGEMARRLNAARVVVDAARTYVDNGPGSIGTGYGALQAALFDHDKERDE